MPPPATVPDFLDLVRRSAIVNVDRLDAVLADCQRKGGLPGSNEKVAQLFVQEGLLTNFQAKQLLQGRWRRFMIGSKYKLLELLGAGGMGAVYLCEHIFMRRLVALKVLPVDKLSEPSMLERFYREARASAALDHPNIVRAYDIDQYDKLHFLVMEYVEGSSLQEIVARFGPLSIERACHYIAQSAHGLQHAHEAGMVHRDIKPGNLLVDKTGVVKVLDMGLARFFGNKNDSVTEKYDDRSVLGTADYLAPEQAISRPLDIRADIYSLGGTFYFLLTGQLLFPDGTIAQKLIFHQKKEPKPIREYRPEVPARLAAIIQRMLAKKPEDRFQTPAEVIEALAPWISEPIPAPPAQEMPQLCRAVQNVVNQSEGAKVPGSQSPESAPAPTGKVSAVSRPRTPAPGYQPQRPGSTVASASRGTAILPPPPRPVRKAPPVPTPDTGRYESPEAPSESVSPPFGTRKVPLIPILAGVALIAAVAGGMVAFFTGGLNRSGTTTAQTSSITPTLPESNTPQVETPPASVPNEPNITVEALLQQYDKVVSIEFRVNSTGGQTNVYLNSLEDFRSPENLAVKLPPEIVDELKKRGIDPQVDYQNKRIRAKGKVVKSPSGMPQLVIAALDDLVILE